MYFVLMSVVCIIIDRWICSNEPNIIIDVGCDCDIVLSKKKNAFGIWAEKVEIESVQENWKKWWHKELHSKFLELVY